jgi:spore maturation protein CgeB
MLASMQYLLRNRAAAADQAARGLETLLARHTCAHRAQQLIAICQELLA